MNKFFRFLGKNRPTVLTLVGTAGLIATSVMAYKSAESVQIALDTAWNLAVSENPEREEELTRREKAWVYVKTLWPTFALGAVSTTLIILGNSDHIARRNAALAAYYISESTLKDYQAEVIKEIGEKKERSVRDRVAEKHLNETPVNEKMTVISSSDKPWICDTATGCYFRMSYEKFMRIMAEANLEMYKRDYISVSDLYEMLEVQLPPGGDWFLKGWSARNGDIDYYHTSAVREINGEVVPCLVVEYRYKPVYDFDVYG